jgi:hypothetical protein
MDRGSRKHVMLNQIARLEAVVQEKEKIIGILRQELAEAKAKPVAGKKEKEPYEGFKDR